MYMFKSNWRKNIREEESDRNGKSKRIVNPNGETRRFPSFIGNGSKNGYIRGPGKIAKVKYGHSTSLATRGSISKTCDQVLKTKRPFNWDLWLGPSEFKPLIPLHLHPFWMEEDGGNMGTGALGDVGCHFDRLFHLELWDLSITDARM